jgi:hypothetical protein
LPIVGIDEPTECDAIGNPVDHFCPGVGEAV